MTTTMIQTTFPILLAVAAGGSIGAIARYLTGVWVMQRFVVYFPLATLLVNAVGALLIGVLFVFISERALMSESLRPLLVVGLLGSLTTFPTFSLEVVNLIQQGEMFTAMAYIIGSVILCVSLTWLGMILARLV